MMEHREPIVCDVCILSLMVRQRVCAVKHLLRLLRLLYGDNMCVCCLYVMCVCCHLVYFGIMVCFFFSFPGCELMGYLGVTGSATPKHKMIFAYISCLHGYSFKFRI